MSTPAAIDFRGHLNGWLQGIAGMYMADIRAIPEEKWTGTFGGCTRPANAITGDALAFLAWTTEALKGNTSPYGEQNISGMTEQVGSREAAISKVNEVTKAFNEAFASASDETLNSTVELPWGQMSLYALAQTAVNHLWYHDGQLNYIQCLLGDGEVHWMGAQ